MKYSKKYIQTLLSEDEKSPLKDVMREARKYYDNKGEIAQRKRYAVSRTGEKIEEKFLSNTKLAHPFFSDLVDQKVSHLVSRPFSISTENTVYQELLEGFFGDVARNILQNVTRDSVICGISWVQVYYSEDGRLGIKSIPAEEIVPIWSNADRSSLSAVIRHYHAVEVDDDGKQKTVRHIEYHTPEGVVLLIEDKGDLVEISQKGHFSVTDGENAQPATWERLPFIPFRYNPDERSLLGKVKSLIDDYDFITSELSNSIKDVPNNIRVIRGYDGRDVQTVIHNMNIYRTIFIQGDGDISSLDTTLDITAVEAHLTRLRKDIWTAGRGVDTQDESLGNASGIALKFRYSLLELDCETLGNQLKAAMRELLWFIATDIRTRTGEDYVDDAVDIIFNTDLVIHESEIIADARVSTGIISQETIIANHPWVTDVAVEMERLEHERGEMSAFGGYEFPLAAQTQSENTED